MKQSLDLYHILTKDEQNTEEVNISLLISWFFNRYFIIFK